MDNKFAYKEMTIASKKFVVMVICLAGACAALGLFLALQHNSQKTSHPKRAVSEQALYDLSKKSEYLDRIDKGDVEAGLILIKALDLTRGSTRIVEIEKVARKLITTDDARIQYVLGSTIIEGLFLVSNPRELSEADKARADEALGYLAKASSQGNANAQHFIETIKPFLKSDKNKASN
jgi:hypothetical protein